MFARAYGSMERKKRKLRVPGSPTILHIVGQEPAVLAVGAGWVGCFFNFFILSTYLPFLMPHLLGDSWAY